MIIIKKKYITIIIIILLVFLTLIMYFNLKKDKYLNTISVSTFNVSSEACIVMNIDTKEIYYQKAINKILLPASLTKILTTITALEYMNVDRYYQIKLKDLLIEGSKIYLEPNDFIKGIDLLYGIMLRSGNDASNVIANVYGKEYADFIQKMNELAMKIGMKSSTFNNPTGLDEDTENRTTAYDLALLMSYAMQNQTFYEIVNTKVYRFTSINKSFLLINKHKLIHEDCGFIGGKTGYTKKAKRTLISCFEQNNSRIVVVTLNAFDDWNLHKQLSLATFKIINKDLSYE